MAQAQNVSANAVSGVQPLSYLNQNQPATVLFVRQKRAPNTNDRNYKFSTIWLDTTTDQVFLLVNVKANEAIWVFIGSTGGFPITPFVVSQTNEGEFKTIQEGIDAANEVGGGMIYVQPGTYTEDLTLFDKINLVSIVDISSAVVEIIGTHSLPASGTISMRGFLLDGNNAIMSANFAGSTKISFQECTFAVTSGWTLDIGAWTGDIIINDCKTLSAQDGIVNNAGGSSSIFIKNSDIGAGTNFDFIIRNDLMASHVIIECPINIQGNALIVDFSLFTHTITIGGGTFGDFFFCELFPLSGPAIDMTSSGDVALNNCSINSTNDPAIDGTTALTLNQISFGAGTKISSALTLSTAPVLLTSEYRTTNQITGLSMVNAQIMARGSATNIPILIATKGTGDLFVTSNLQIDNLGSGLAIKEGANARMGTAVLVMGVAVVPNTQVTANSRIFLMYQVVSGSVNILRISARTPGVSFTIDTGSPLDASTVAWIIIEPA